MKSILSISFLSVFFLSACHAKESTKLEAYGDFYQLALPTAAILSEEGISKHSAVISMIEVQIAVNSIKYLTGVPRPSRSRDHVFVSHFSRATSSFPSGHTAAAAAGATYLIMNFRDLGTYQAALIAGLVGMSRINANMHFNNDVAIGAIIGVSITALNEFFKKKSHTHLFNTKTDISISPNSITFRY